MLDGDELLLVLINYYPIEQCLFMGHTAHSFQQDSKVDF